MLLSVSIYSCASDTKVINLIDYNIKDNSDITEVVRNILKNENSKSVKFIFPKGIYHFSKSKSYTKFLFITNHDSGYKNIAFNLNHFENVEIDGQGSEFVFHDEMLPFLIEDCQNISLKNFSVDWEIPFFVQGEVVAVGSTKGWIELKMFQKGFSYKVQGESLKFPLDNNSAFSSIGESLVFDKATKSPIYNSGVFDIHRKVDVKVQQQANLNLRFYENLKAYPPLNSIVVFKGKMGENRYAPAFHCLRSSNVEVYNVNVFHALGMGFLGEKSEDILLKKFNIMLRQGSDRYISTTADATHFCNCKGNVEIDSCLFENMLDDGTNVHGTYIKVDSIVNKNSVIACLQHFQQAGFIFGEKGDEVWFLIAPNSTRSNENKVVSFIPINKFYAEITFEKPISNLLKKGDLIENKTWNTTNFILHNSIIRNNRARNIVLKAPGKILIENNRFQSMMASILIRGEADQWYESGAVEDVIIRNNKFENCVLGGGKQAILLISPKLGNSYDDKLLFDKNVTFENNTINTFDNIIVDASRVNSLRLINNKIFQNNDYEPFNKNSSLINIRNCKNVLINKNDYNGNNQSVLQIDTISKSTSKIEDTNGFISKNNN